MKLLLAEMLSPVIAERLRDRGYDVEAVAADPAHVSLSEEEVLAVARTQGRAVVTNNVVDFRPLHHEAVAPGGAGHHGMVFLPGTFRRAKADTGRIVSALDAKLREFPGDGDLADAETWL